MKLPAFYLLDAISKNVYELYARRFSAFVVPLYLETYSQVDEGTRGKMEEMLLTWRTGSPTGKELFGVPQQIAIERGVWGDGGTSNAVGLPFFVPRPSSSFFSVRLPLWHWPNHEIPSPKRTSIHIRPEGAYGPVKSLRYGITESHCRPTPGMF
jgi:hypothetical protein